MSDDELLQFVKEFRDGILDGTPSEMMCFAICAPLITLLNMSGVQAEMRESDLPEMNHFWIQLSDGRALDPTADQFDANLPPVYLGKPLEFHP